jgi:Phage QLRG family, putative DNA packaging.
MDEAAILSLVKATLGYRSTVRDELLTATIKSVVAELTDTIGIELNSTSDEHIMFIVDLATFRYKNQGGETMPRNLEYRLRNLIIKYRGKKDVG